MRSASTPAPLPVRQSPSSVFWPMAASASRMICAPAATGWPLRSAVFADPHAPAGGGGCERLEPAGVAGEFRVVIGAEHRGIGADRADIDSHVPSHISKLPLARKQGAAAQVALLSFCAALASMTAWVSLPAGPFREQAARPQSNSSGGKYTSKWPVVLGKNRVPEQQGAAGWRWRDFRFANKKCPRPSEPISHPDPDRRNRPRTPPRPRTPQPGAMLPAAGKHVLRPRWRGMRRFCLQGPKIGRSRRGFFFNARRADSF